MESMYIKKIKVYDTYRHIKINWGLSDILLRYFARDYFFLNACAIENGDSINSNNKASKFF